ncbi:hypothetical protein BH23CHL5_BH23CHL5_18070 [soil metagenome]
MATADARNRSDRELWNDRRFAMGLAALRVFMGLVIFMNGLAKIDADFGRFDIGWYRGNLVTQEDARRILNFEVNERGQPEPEPPGTQVPGVRTIANDLLLEHWNIFKWILTLTEFGVGLLLILGALTRLAALIGLGFTLWLAAIYFSSNRWMFEQPHEYIPMAILALVPAGRMWGIDALLLRNRPTLRRWPF